MPKKQGGLQLSCAIGQQISIEHGGETLTVTLTDVHGNHADILFDGPLSFVVYRPDRKEQTVSLDELVRSPEGHANADSWAKARTKGRKL